jgi:hypothetical protein
MIINVEQLAWSPQAFNLLRHSVQINPSDVTNERKCIILESKKIRMELFKSQVKNHSNFNNELKTISLRIPFEVKNGIYQKYLNQAIIHKLNSGLDNLMSIKELRQVTTLFIRIEDVKFRETFQTKDLEMTQSAIEIVQKIVVKYEGILRQFAVDDKGAVLLSLFGLPPLAHESDSLYGVNAAIEICEKFKNTFDEFSIGVTTGVVSICGFGNTQRTEYALMGDSINMAARLMFLEDAFCSVLCDERTKLNCGEEITFKALPLQKVKGKSYKIPVFKPELVTKNAVEKSTDLKKTKTVVIGRVKERNGIVQALQRYNQGTPTCLVLEGEAGSGLSTLKAFTKEEAYSMGMQVISGKTSEVYKSHTLYAFKHIVVEMLELLEDYPKDVNDTLSESKNMNFNSLSILEEDSNSSSNKNSSEIQYGVTEDSAQKTKSRRSLGMAAAENSKQRNGNKNEEIQGGNNENGITKNINRRSSSIIPESIRSRTPNKNEETQNVTSDHHLQKIKARRSSVGVAEKRSVEDGNPNRSFTYRYKDEGVKYSSSLGNEHIKIFTKKHSPLNMDNKYEEENLSSKKSSSPNSVSSKMVSNNTSFWKKMSESVTKHVMKKEKADNHMVNSSFVKNSLTSLELQNIQKKERSRSLLLSSYGESLDKINAIDKMPSKGQYVSCGVFEKKIREMLKYLKENENCAPLFGLIFPKEFNENEESDSFQGKTRIRELTDILKRLFIKLCKVKKTLLFIEECQWMDNLSWTMCQDLFTDCPELMVCIFSRPERQYISGFSFLRSMKDHSRTLLIEISGLDVETIPTLIIYYYEEYLNEYHLYF